MGAERQHVSYGKRPSSRGIIGRRCKKMKNSNQINVPQAREAMDKFKMQAAQDFDGPVTY